VRYAGESVLLTAHPIAKDGVAADATVTTEVVVRFAETDAMGIVHHSAYIVWFEAARVAWMAAQGIPYAQFAAEGNHFAVTGINVAYRHSCRFGDVVLVETQVTHVRSRQVTFAYKVRRASDGTLLANATSEHVCVDLEGRVATIPHRVLEILQQGIS
jgi:acyl-CoA thioester hydrolase